MEEVANVEVAAEEVVHLVTNLEEVEEEAQDKLLHPGVAPEVVEVAMEIKEVMVVALKEDMAAVLKEAMEAAAAVEAHGEVLKVKEDRILGAKTKAEEVVMVEEVKNNFFNISYLHNLINLIQSPKNSKQKKVIL